MGSRRGKGKARAMMSISVIHQHLNLDRDRIQGFILEHICGFIWIYNVCGVKDGWARDLIYEIILFDPVTTLHISQFQVRWLHRRIRGWPFREWWAAFCSYMGKCLIKPMTKWTTGGGITPAPVGIKLIAPISRQPARRRWNTWVSISLGIVVMISGQRLSRQAAGSTNQTTSWPLDHLMSKETFDKDDDDANWADPRGQTGGSNHPGNGNDNDDSKGEEDI